jgi:hypothetical protein
MSKKMGIRIKILLSHTFPKKKEKFLKKNEILFKKKALWRLKRSDEKNVKKNPSLKMLKIDFILT